MTKKPIMGLILLLVLVAIWLISRTPVYEGPCRVDILAFANPRSDNLQVTCGGKSANASKRAAIEANFPLREALFWDMEVPCKVFRNGSADCNFKGYHRGPSLSKPPVVQ